VNNKLPISLRIGLILLFLFIAISILGPRIAPYEIAESEKIRKGENGFEFSPFRPDLTHLFGTDIYGFDIFSNILNGASFTIFFALITAAVRVILGTVFASLPGGISSVKSINWNKKQAPALFKLLHGFSALPTLVFVYFILVNITFNSPLSPWKLAFYQGIVIVLAGIPGSYSMMQGKISEIYKSEHVEAAISYGSTWIRVVSHHTLPLIVDQLLLSFIREAISVLVLLGQLGIFNVFIGGTTIQPSGLSPIIYLTRTYEWAGLIGYYREYIFSNYWWIILFPLAAYFGLLITLYITLKGLNSYFKKKIKQNSIL
jgi:peptide/nickel transport system permease protein